MAARPEAFGPPPVPPPVPPAVPPATAALVPPPLTPAVPPPVPAAADTADDGVIRVGRPRVAHRARSDGGGLALGLAALVITAGAIAAYVAWPHLQRTTTIARKSAEQPHRPEHAPQPAPRPLAGPPVDARPAPQPPASPAPQPAPTPDPAPSPAPSPTPKPEPQPPPEPPLKLSPTPAPAAVPMTETEPPPPAVDVEKIRSTVGAAIAKGYEALRTLDFASAKRHFEAVADEALDDQEATDRLQRWRQLALYAEQYPDYRDQALASASSTSATYDLGRFQIAVVEFTPREFIYRDSRRPGRNLRVPRDAIPADVEQGLVEQWFAKDGRAANHLFLGAAALARREPDIATARREWRAAADGGEPHGTLLLELLNDPAVRGR